MSRRFLCILVVLATWNFAAAQHLKLIVAGDGRSDPGAKPPRSEDVNGINTLITGEIVQAVLAEKASALLWTGDLVLGNTSDRQKHKSQLEDWVKIVQPLWNHGMKVFPVRGNHEQMSKDSGSVWREIFTGNRGLPQNGPEGAKDLTYWVEMDNVLILGIDQYAYAPETVPLNWLKETLAAHKKPHIFAFGHEMAFMAGHHKDNLSVNAKNRDDFMNTLIRAGSKAYFSGHDHFYDHLIATSSAGVIHQYVAGTAGAPRYSFDGYTQANPGWETVPVLHLPKTQDDPMVFGYLVIEIDGPNATITFKGRTAPGKFESLDTWGYTAQ